MQDNSAEKEFYYCDIATKENFNEKKPKDGRLILNLVNFDLLKLI